MPNASSIIKFHNKNILESQPESRTPKCNCRDQDTCPRGGECLIDNVVYLAEVTNNKNSERKSYIRLTALTFKDRLYKHRNSLRYRTKANNTELSIYVWSHLTKMDQNVPTLSHREVSHNFPQRRGTFEQKMRDSVELPTQKQIPYLQFQINTPG